MIGGHGFRNADGSFARTLAASLTRRRLTSGHCLRCDRAWNDEPVPIDFADSPEPTLGVEWEFALVDKQSRDLVNAASELFDLVSLAPRRPATASTRSCSATPSS